MTQDKDFIKNLRIAAGTLPSEKPIKQTRIIEFKDSIEISIEDHSVNPYKAMFVSSTSTWGDNDFVRKWPITELKGKLEVIKAVLTHNTLPQAKEMVYFLFRVKGVPRWLFDYHTEVNFCTFMSIGCRDNNKVDADIIKSKHALDDEIFTPLKDLYESMLNDDQSSWQSARAFLPQSYSHSYHFGQNLLSIVSVKGFHASKKFEQRRNLKDYFLMLLYKEIQSKIGEKFPLLALYLELMFTYDQDKVFKQISNLTIDDLSQQDLILFNKD